MSLEMDWWTSCEKTKLRAQGPTKPSRLLQDSEKYLINTWSLMLVHKVNSNFCSFIKQFISTNKEKLWLPSNPSATQPQFNFQISFLWVNLKHWHQPLLFLVLRTLTLFPNIRNTGLERAACVIQSICLDCRQWSAGPFWKAFKIHL